MKVLATDDGIAAIEQARHVTEVLDAIDQLLDAIECLDAPITRELLRTAMTALVHECKLQDGPLPSTH